MFYQVYSLKQGIVVMFSSCRINSKIFSHLGLNFVVSFAEEIFGSLTIFADAVFYLYERANHLHGFAALAGAEY